MSTEACPEPVQAIRDRIVKLLRRLPDVCFPDDPEGYWELETATEALCHLGAIKDVLATQHGLRWQRLGRQTSWVGKVSKRDAKAAVHLSYRCVNGHHFLTVAIEY